MMTLYYLMKEFGLWPVVLPIVFVAALTVKNLRIRWERYKRHRAV